MLDFDFKSTRRIYCRRHYNHNGVNLVLFAALLLRLVGLLRILSKVTLVKTIGTSNIVEMKPNLEPYLKPSIKNEKKERF